MKSQLERANDPPTLTPREQQQVAQWNRPKREDRAMEQAAQEILETAALPDEMESFRFVWTKADGRNGFQQKWVPMSQERGSKFKALSKAAKLTTSFGVGTGAGAKVFGAGVAGVGAQTNGRPNVLSQDDPMAAGVAVLVDSARTGVTASAKPMDICYHCKKPGHWKIDCPMLADGYDYRKGVDTSVSAAKLKLEQAVWDHQDPLFIERCELNLQIAEAKAQIVEQEQAREQEQAGVKKARKKEFVTAPLPPMLTGARGEDAEDATRKMQAIQRGRAPRKELNDQKAAAVRIQAIQRGKATRKGVSNLSGSRLGLEPEPEFVPEDEVAAEFIAAAIDFGIVSAYDDMVEAPIAGVIDGTTRVLPLPKMPEPDRASRARYRRLLAMEPLEPEPEPEVLAEANELKFVMEDEFEREDFTDDPVADAMVAAVGTPRGTLKPTPPSQTGPVPTPVPPASDAGRTKPRVNFKGGTTSYLSTASRLPGQRVTSYGPSARLTSIAPSTHGLWPATESGAMRQDRQAQPVSGGRSVKFKAGSKGGPPAGAGTEGGGKGRTARARDGKKQEDRSEDINDRSAQKWRQHVPGPGGVKQLPGDSRLSGSLEETGYYSAGAARHQQ